MDLVRSELDRDPAIGLEALYDKAKEIDPAVAEMSQRQFHARYPLQVKRGRGSKGGSKPAAAKKRRAKSARAAETPSAARPRRARGAGAAEEAGTGIDRDAIRGVFMEFASDFAQAESRQEIVRVLSSIDGYVDRVHQLVRGS